FAHRSPHALDLPSFPTRRSSDLPGLARRIHADCARAPLALLDPDETTIAVLDHGLDTRFTILTSDHDASRAIVTRWFSDQGREADRKSTRLNSSHRTISYAVFCL